ncbi:DUF1471 domain-containing protein [Erwiniaceae bacterium BAC15a-03b]|uniref:DUF1471 domain-containing protein n=1 Tax=Winslowiella arboricola TaxID=2978220 RepID=A0A9J6PX41_9GAMM|nr:YdgH/BhsA/McbA-like domain containing protein [Winslowiella arboricola]MCU5775302.1 DUF1471 domain-containing protein [Winslowiella arboricola]MCU5780301.1 DUF1471 domain-containing protein [Winslowiella arboricola]
MRLKKFILPLLILGSYSVNSFAVRAVNSDEGLTKIGTISASGATTLSGLENRLALKAEERGASAYRIISAGGENRLYGVAVIYK